MSKKLDVRLLGKFEVSRGGKPINIASRPAQSLFAYLILSAGTPHRREKLAGLLWPDSLEETARENLRHALWRLRKALESAGSARFLNADDLRIKFEASADYWLDVAELEKLSNDASTDQLRAVLSNYEGELLPGFYDDWVAAEREHFHSIFEHHMARLLSLLQKENRWLDILEWGERWIKLGQKPEPAYRALMIAHAANGDMSKVAATYERCVKALKEFGVELSQETRVLYERLRTRKESLGAASEVSVTEPRPGPLKTNLPAPLTSFIGREREIEDAKYLLSSARLLTLTGAGGIGKTRLAVQVAREFVRSFKDGVWWVELALLNDPALVPQAVMQVLGVRESSDQTLMESIKEFLRQKQLLLILDNCEHLIAACAQLTDDLLSQCANLRIMTTSREILGITGEAILQVPALSSPVQANLYSMQAWNEFESIQLFIERAEAAHPGLRLTQPNAFAVMQICHRLDGIPLAIELAAARVKLLSLEEIAKRLDDRFTFLTQGSRTALPRHQTLRAAIDWSYDLLSKGEQVLFRRLAVFSGGWTLEAAQEVCSGDGITVDKVLDLLTGLVGKSLVIRQAQDGETRYRMLETVRLYAQEKMLDAERKEQLYDLHLDFFLKFAEAAESHSSGMEAPAWLDRIQNDWDNLRFAIRWSLENDLGEKGLRIASALAFFAWAHGYLQEIHQTLVELLKSQSTVKRTTAFGKAFLVLAASEVELGMEQEARLHYEESISILREAGEEGRALLATGLGSFAHTPRWSDSRDAVRSAEEAVQLCRESGNREGLVIALTRLAEARTWMGDGESACTLFRESATIGQEIGNQFLYHFAVGNLGFAELCYGDREAARRDLEAFNSPWVSNLQMGLAFGNVFLGLLARLEGQNILAETRLEEAVRLLREIGEKRYLAMALVFLGRVKLDKGNREAAEECFRQAFSVALEASAWIFASWSLESFAYLSLARNQAPRAIRLLGSAETWREQLGTPLLPMEREEHETALVRAHAQLNQATFDAAWAEGHAMTLEQVIGLALKEAK